ncbi:hypothetical protein RhiirA5_374016 [Rhizophagus irregularis]|uniref:Uncharacterized protein n=1 Tax=Rhizophagus irregularis TaxID=588596 RepID=A0A2N0PWN3_9GLOM|nr:hypothetical protein RhiirA5_374016 [Rhizophagus irregularis]
MGLINQKGEFWTNVEDVAIDRPLLLAKSINDLEQVIRDGRPVKISWNCKRLSAVKRYFIENYNSPVETFHRITYKGIVRNNKNILTRMNYRQKRAEERDAHRARERERKRLKLAVETKNEPFESQSRVTGSQQDRAINLQNQGLLRKFCNKVDKILFARFRGGKHGYRGNVINFPQNVQEFRHESIVIRKIKTNEISIQEIKTKRPELSTLVSGIAICKFSHDFSTSVKVSFFPAITGSGESTTLSKTVSGGALEHGPKVLVLL